MVEPLPIGPPWHDAGAEGLLAPPAPGRIDPTVFVAALTGAGFSLVTGVPCGHLQPLVSAVLGGAPPPGSSARGIAYLAATNEGDAVAIAAGAELAGKRAVVMMENSGLGNAVGPLTSLHAVHRIPTLLVVTLRGEPGGPVDEPQHELIGAITTKLLDLMGIAWAWLPREDAAIAAAVERAAWQMSKTELPYALVVRPGTITSLPTARSIVRPPTPRELAPSLPSPNHGTKRARPSREEALLAVQRAVDARDLVIATAGYTERELYACEDRVNQLYIVGAVGCASSVGLGIAWARRDRRVVVLDGDGAMLTRMGALATIGYERPSNLVHVVFDNEAHESMGGQATVAGTIDLAAVARSLGYPSVLRAARASELEELLRDRSAGLRFVHLKTRPGTPSQLPRPSVTPREVAQRVRKLLTGTPTEAV